MIFEKIFNKTLFFLFLVYLTIFIFAQNNYYDYEAHKRVELTNEEIEKFEYDIKNGNNIDINDYVSKTKDDYSNKLSNISSNFSETTSKYVKSMIKGIIKIIDKYFS